MSKVEIRIHWFSILAFCLITPFLLISCRVQNRVSLSDATLVDQPESGLEQTELSGPPTLATSTNTPTPSYTPSPTPTPTPSSTPKPTCTPTATQTPTVTPTYTPTPKPNSTRSEPGNPVFTVAVIVDRLSEPVTRQQAQELIDKASQFSQLQTSIPIKMVDFIEDWRDPLVRDIVEDYIDKNPTTLPNGIVVLSTGGISGMFGGFAFSSSGPPGYKNPFKSPLVGDDEVYVSVVHYSHRYGRCGYGSDNPEDPITNTSLGGECQGQDGTRCVEHLGYSMCHNVINFPYASDRIYFPASGVVHEILHSFGYEGAWDHFSTVNCKERMSSGQSSRSYHVYTNWYASNVAAHNESQY